MPTTQLRSNPDVFMISVPFDNISTNATNCYVLRDGSDTLIIDPGAPSEGGRKVLDKALAELSVDPRSASYFLTHFHLDHAGLVDQVVPEAAPLFVGRKEFERTRQTARLTSANELQQRALSIGADADEAEACRRIHEEGSRYVEGNYNLQLVEEGDVIAVGNYRLEVFDSSGHTPGHISLFEASTGIFFGGDHVLFVISPSVDFFPQGENGIERYLENLKRTAELPISSLYHSHGAIREDFNDRIAWLAQHHLDRLDEVERCVAESPGISGIDLIRALRWNVPADSWEGISLIQRAIIITQGLVILDHLEKSGRLCVERTRGEDDRYFLPSAERDAQ